MIDKIQNEKWAENVILADADYIDAVAFELIVNFERMIGRRIPQADTARWIDCVALDGRLREGDNKVQVVLVHAREHTQMENFKPGRFDDELDGKAFKDHLGEFLISAVTSEGMASNESLFNDALAHIGLQKGVKRLMVVPNAEKYLATVSETIRHIEEADDDKRITLFAMQPLAGVSCRQEILGYSLMSALGIRADEIRE